MLSTAFADAPVASMMLLRNIIFAQRTSNPRGLVGVSLHSEQRSDQGQQLDCKSLDERSQLQVRMPQRGAYRLDLLYIEGVIEEVEGELRRTRHERSVVSLVEPATGKSYPAIGQRSQLPLETAVSSSLRVLSFPRGELGARATLVDQILSLMSIPALKKRNADDSIYI